MTEMITFQPKQQPAYIKVIGVGGGGSNAVNHMFIQGIQGVDFIVCNTDVQALESSPVPVKIILGDRILGAGSKPEVGREAAIASIDSIRECITDDTQMVFITAGMGGGTGTGAAPIIAEVAREMGMLSVGIVTLPFLWEGRRRRQQAEAGIEEIRKHVDTLLVICNDKLREQYGNLSVSEAFARADNVLTSAAKGIAELITVPGYVNIDFEDVKTVIESSGKAIMGSATAEGEGRALKAIEDAMSSPLLNDNDIKGAQNILLYIMTGTEDITMDEITEITDYVHQESGGDHDADVIWGNGNDESLGNQIGITIIATGFDTKKKKVGEVKPRVVGGVGNADVNVNEASKKEDEEDSQPSFKSVLHKDEKDEPVPEPEIRITKKPIEEKEEKPVADSMGKKIVHALDEKIKEEKPVAESKPEVPTYFGKTSQPHLSIQRTVTSMPVPEEKEKERIVKPDDPMEKNAKHRSQMLKDLSMFRPEHIEEFEKEPAFKRKNIELDNSTPSSDSSISRYTLGEDSKNNPTIKTDNSFLHDNVD